MKKKWNKTILAFLLLLFDFRLFTLSLGMNLIIWIIISFTFLMLYCSLWIRDLVIRAIHLHTLSDCHISQWYLRPPWIICQSLLKVTAQKYIWNAGKTELATNGEIQLSTDLGPSNEPHAVYIYLSMWRVNPLIKMLSMQSIHVGKQPQILWWPGNLRGLHMTSNV